MIVLVLFILTCLILTYASMTSFKRRFLKAGLIDEQQAKRVDLVIRHMFSFTLLGGAGLILLARDLLSPPLAAVWLGLLGAYSIYAATTYVSMFRDIVATRKRKKRKTDILADYQRLVDAAEAPASTVSERQAQSRSTANGANMR